MNRKAFFASLLGTLGVARAQKIGRRPDWPKDSTTTEVVVAAKNQCPVCGIVADPYTRPKGLGEVTPVSLQYGDNPGVGMTVLMRNDGTPYGPMERLARCKRCNAAFWQDAKE